jgi:hypothetical protein
MIGRVFEATWKTGRFPSVWLPCAVGTLGSHWAFGALHAERGFWSQTLSAMACLAVVLAVRFWLDLSTTQTAMAVLRAHGRWRPTRWTPVTVAVEAGLVSMALAVPILAGLVFLIVPGIIVALRWSQAAFLILDDRAHWFDAASESEGLTAGRRWPVLVVWLVAGGVMASTEWLTASLGAAGDALFGTPLWSTTVTSLATVAADVFGLVVLAALYIELDTIEGPSVTATDPRAL